jgi:hypothetical protein
MSHRSRCMSAGMFLLTLVLSDATAAAAEPPDSADGQMLNSIERVRHVMRDIATAEVQASCARRANA